MLNLPGKATFIKLSEPSKLGRTAASVVLLHVLPWSLRSVKLTRTGGDWSKGYWGFNHSANVFAAELVFKQQYQLVEQKRHKGDFQIKFDQNGQILFKNKTQPNKST